MSSRRYRIRVALALIAFGVLGSSLVFACLYRDGGESLFDVVRPDLTAGVAARDQLEFADAEMHFQRVVDLTEPVAALETYDPEVHAMGLIRLGEVLEDQGRVREAERCYKRALDATNPSGNPYDESRISPLSHLRNLYTSAEDVERAEEARTEIDSIVTRVEPIYLRAIELQRRLNAKDKALLADDLMKLANLYYARGETKRSEPLYAEVFAIRSRKGGKGGAEGDVLGPLLRMGMTKAHSDEDSAAAEIFRETLVVREAQYGPQSPILITNLYNLGMLAYRQGRLVEADSLLTRALTIEEDRLGKNHPISAPILASLAECSRDRGLFASAQLYQMRVNEIQRRVYGSDSRVVGAGLLALAEIQGAAGDRLKARQTCDEALKVTIKASWEFDPQAFECRNAMTRLSRYAPEPRIEVAKGRTLGARPGKRSVPVSRVG